MPTNTERIREYTEHQQHRPGPLNCNADVSQLCHLLSAFLKGTVYYHTKMEKGLRLHSGRRKQPACVSEAMGFRSDPTSLILKSLTDEEGQNPKAFYKSIRG